LHVIGEAVATQSVEEINHRLALAGNVPAHEPIAVAKPNLLALAIVSESRRR
jgi:hypothetical protein